MRLYRKVYIPYQAKKIRKKEKIRVLFVLSSLGAWKSESLYKEMIKHPRFDPFILICPYEDENWNQLIEYCQINGYNFDIGKDVNINTQKIYKPDLIFYQKPYGHGYAKNLKSLFCYTTYTFHNSIQAEAYKTDLIYNCWQVYYENNFLCNFYSSNLGRGIVNGYATGIPYMDDLLIPKENLKDPWPKKSNKKRVIYAPHHSINPDNWWQTSTFLEIGEIMLELAEKYSNKIQWAFKPHPLLRGKLESLWGKEKTDVYYNRWAESSWSQFEDGEYLGLFKYSDALIHDCGSFMVEYHVTKNPVLFLLRSQPTQQPWNDIYLKAYNLHYKAHSKTEIEQFILNIIENNDPQQPQRKNFYSDFFIPPYNRTASKNIIDCILSKDAKKKYRN